MEEKTAAEETTRSGVKISGSHAEETDEVVSAGQCYPIYSYSANPWNPTWVCPACDAENSEQVKVCGVCGAARPAVGVPKDEFPYPGGTGGAGGHKETEPPSGGAGPGKPDEPKKPKKKRGGILVVLAVALAALAAWKQWLRGLMAPLVAAVKTVPVASFIILALVWLNSRSLSLFISALMVFPPVYLNVLEGICRTDRRLLEMARVFRVPLGRRLRGIYLPQVMPYFRTAVSLGLGLCWKAGAAAEIIGLPAGSMGERLYTAKVYFQTADLFAWTVTIVAVSVAFERLFLALVDRLMGKAGL